ncbi:MAG: type II toxin-antitoxin system VapC family toxin [candidate division KSB1 bacterium]|nr:type II toxin-antitoxin system VapC family toxin [candidate division KSB1 bacterium]
MGKQEMNILLDTNIVIYFLKGEKKVVENVRKAENIAISFITEIELNCYDAEPDEMKKISSFLQQIEIFYPVPETVKHTINIRKSTGLKLPDAIICAQSLQHNYTLFSNDKKILNKPLEMKAINPLR